MENFKDTIRRKGITIILLYLLAIFIIFIPVFLILNNKGYVNNCTVIVNKDHFTSYKDFNKCLDKGGDINLVINDNDSNERVYDLSFLKYDSVNFFDINVGGYVIITKVDPETANYLRQKGSKTLKVKRATFGGEYSDIVEQTKRVYIDNLTEEMSEEELLELFSDVQLEAYSKLSFVDMGLIIIFFLGIIYFIIKMKDGLAMFLFPKNYKLNKVNTIDDMIGLNPLSDLIKDKKEVLKSIELKMFNDDIVIETLTKLFVFKISDLVWVYEVNKKVIGFKNTAVMFNTRYGKSFLVKIKKEDIDFVFNEISRSNVLIRKGFDSNYLDVWNKDYSKFLERTKNENK